MAINKNFVIKNGVQVATDLIVGDSDTKKVGIGTTIDLVIPYMLVRQMLVVEVV